MRVLYTRGLPWGKSGRYTGRMYGLRPRAAFTAYSALLAPAVTTPSAVPPLPFEASSAPPPASVSDGGRASTSTHADDSGVSSENALASDAPEDEGTVLPASWSGVIGVEGEATGDGRLIEHDALEWTTPIPLRFVYEDTGAHDGAVVVGRILSITRNAGLIEASGDFDLDSVAGREAARMVSKELLTGVSMDLDSVSFELRVASEVYEEQVAFLDEMLGEDGGNASPPEPETDDEGRVIVGQMNADDELMVTTAARIRAATLVSVPAFASAQIEAVAAPHALAASAAPVAPPAEWFDDPALSGPTALSIDENGRVRGHLATWDTCHIADPSGTGTCVRAPRSPSGYAYFHTGAVKTAQGSIVPTGALRFDTSHASPRASATDAAAHYDHTGFAGADVHVGEDQFGIWVAGALRPGLSEEQVRTLRASPLSGDWRQIDGHLELVGALAVNLPGFPIPRPSGLVASGDMTTLTAAGVVPRNRLLAGRAVTLTSAQLEEVALRAARLAVGMDTHPTAPPDDPEADSQVDPHMDVRALASRALAARVEVARGL